MKLSLSIGGREEWGTCVRGSMRLLYPRGASPPPPPKKKIIIIRKKEALICTWKGLWWQDSQSYSGYLRYHTSLVLPIFIQKLGLVFLVILGLIPGGTSGGGLRLLPQDVLRADGVFMRQGKLPSDHAHREWVKGLG